MKIFRVTHVQDDNTYHNFYDESDIDVANGTNLLPIFISNLIELSLTENETFRLEIKINGELWIIDHHKQYHNI